MLIWLYRPIYLLSVHFSRLDMLTPISTCVWIDFQVRLSHLLRAFLRGANVCRDLLLLQGPPVHSCYPCGYLLLSLGFRCIGSTCHRQGAQVVFTSSTGACSCSPVVFPPCGQSKQGV